MFTSSPVEDSVIESRGDYHVRTIENANWSDITLALATNFNTRGEQLTKEAAKDKYVSSILPRESNNNTLAYNNKNAGKDYSSSHYYELTIIEILTKIYDRVSIIIPYKTKYEKNFINNLKIYGLSNEDTNLFITSLALSLMISFTPISPITFLSSIT